ncbi:MAG: nitroreductase family deazaflavin-dependent oxidoreductase [Gammaproteobacteria bacterium]|jgi:deazaflavin-dependent oxidoreductase (nitroreductase family)|nr:nitroreductase family deazaflavin-dependent oxidoreductase [Gammaproteobacteria bacterium]MBP6050320.1 nitroreductase family deazaflavin-dependent oxidoreductase [Pseudomonadales bacterium]MBK6583761.1 nitroreductase family deazaflavin-dependent oxidoreductase [Gammaproteobacteria bacterium]MBK7170969.1 nitroreductase family deazaflavin-dependent oxidoreductase [Gammaproteobacteria bacterium]MBK7522100.1 nitroreductase family deazaflavin-dependent oxidoreductase [Gammaproteobacteria bacteriu
MTSTNRTKMEKPDFMSDEDWAALQDMTSSLERIRGDAKADVEAYLADPAGRSTGSGPSGLPTLLLTCTGRKSGEQRTTPLVFLQDGENMIIVGSLAGYDSHPAWYLNISANPRCQVQLDDRKMAAIARDASDAERKALWPRLTAMFPPWGYFQKQTERPFAIVVLTPTGAA